METPKGLKFDDKGLIPAVVQDTLNGEVLMVGYMNLQAVEATVLTQRVTFWSRSRQEFWIKGETSGNVQHVSGIYVDCDMDCLLVKVEQVGAACHKGYRSCFFREVTENGENLEVIAEPLMKAY